jgi:Protein of unknown function (DUF2652)
MVAQDIIADIMDTLARALRPPFRLAKFEGDAAFVYALADKVDGPLMQYSIEQAYFAFRKRLRNIKQANRCECQACSRMQSLDVKFVVHRRSLATPDHNPHDMTGRRFGVALRVTNRADQIVQGRCWRMTRRA